MGSIEEQKILFRWSMMRNFLIVFVQCTILFTVVLGIGYWVNPGVFPGIIPFSVAMFLFCVVYCTILKRMEDEEKERFRKYGYFN